jgi:hypothetical protein
MAAAGQQCVNSSKGKRSHLLITGGANYSNKTSVQNPITDNLNANVTFNGKARYHSDPTSLVIELTRNHDAGIPVADGSDPGDSSGGLLSITLTNPPTDPAPTPVDPVNVTYVNDSAAAP